MQKQYTIDITFSAGKVVENKSWNSHCFTINSLILKVNHTISVTNDYDVWL